MEASFLWGRIFGGVCIPCIYSHAGWSYRRRLKSLLLRPLSGERYHFLLLGDSYLSILSWRRLLCWKRRGDSEVQWMTRERKLRENSWQWAGRRSIPFSVLTYSRLWIENLWYIALVVMAFFLFFFFSRARILGECSTNHSLPALFFF